MLVLINIFIPPSYKSGTIFLLHRLFVVAPIAGVTVKFVRLRTWRVSSVECRVSLFSLCREKTVYLILKKWPAKKPYGVSRCFYWRFQVRTPLFYG